MKRLRAWGLAGVLTGLLACTGLAVSAQSPAAGSGAVSGAVSGNVTLDVTPDAGRALARQALNSGNPDLAARIAAQLVQADPTDIGALLLLAAGSARSGHAEAGYDAGVKAYHLATTPAQRFEAAFLTAEALSVADKPAAAKHWLRRAATYSPGPQESAVLRDAFQKLQARTPLNFSVTFAGGPSNNVNGGSLHDRFLLFGVLPLPIAVALPGWTLSTTSQLSYRIIAKPKMAASLYAIARQRNVWLAPRAYVLLAQPGQPDVNNADYLYNSLDLGGTVNWARSDTLAFSLDARAGRRWVGGALQNDQQRLVFGITKALTANRLGHLDLTAERTHNPRPLHPNTLRLALNGSLSKPLPGGTLQAEFGLTDLESGAAGEAYHALSAGLDWQPKTPLLGVVADVFVQAEVTDYWKTTGFRPDLQLEAGAMARFPQATAYGFVPTVTLSASRSMSQFVLRDTSTIGIAFGLSSSF